MFLLKLFHESDPVQPIDAHMIGEGTTVIGRDPGVDWVVPDPECEISRRHCELVVDQGDLSLKAVGTNGVFRGETEERFPQGETVPIALGDTFAFGKFRVVVDRVPFSQKSAAEGAHTMVMAPPFGNSSDVPSEWIDGSPIPAGTGDGSLLEAFCEGAGLDASVFSGEEPSEIMRRAGAVYRQMVLGVGDLMNERSSIKTHYRMDRTTISAQDNNPFKWAPSQKLAVDLLLRRSGGFLSGAAALKASFQDIKKHLLSTFAGFHASLRAVLSETSPKTVEERLSGQSHFLKSRTALCWDEFVRAHAQLQEQLSADRDGPINHAFIEAYEQKMRELDADDGQAR